MSTPTTGPGPAPKPVPEHEYEDATNNSLGWCTNCESFTRACTEPDAEGYDCPECGENTVTGAENALIGGMIVLDD